MADRHTQQSSSSSWTALFSVAPATGDNAYVVVDGGQSVTTALDQSAVDLASLHFARVSRLRIGGSGNPLKYELSGPLRYEAGGGFLYFSPAATAAPLIVSASLGELRLVGGLTTELQSSSGKTWLTDQAWLGTANVYGGEVDIELFGSGAVDLNVHGGLVTCRRTMDAVNIDGGRLLVTGGLATADSISLSGGATAQWAGGDIGELTVHEGVFDGGSPERPFTITDLYFSDEADITLAKNVTVTTLHPLGKRGTL